MKMKFKAYLFSIILSFGLVACGGGGSGDVSEEIILNRPPIFELANVENLRGHLIFSDYVLSNRMTLLDKPGLDVIVSNDGNFSLLNENRLIATGVVMVADNLHNYNLTLHFNDTLPDSTFRESASRKLIGKEYTGVGNYDTTLRTLTMYINKKN